MKDIKFDNTLEQHVYFLNALFAVLRTSFTVMFL